MLSGKAVDDEAYHRFNRVLCWQPMLSHPESCMVQLQHEPRQVQYLHHILSACCVSEATDHAG